MKNKARTGSRKPTLIDTMTPEHVDGVERAVRDAKAVPFGKLTRLKLTAGARAELERQLAARGLERGAKAMRIPIEAQIKDLLRGAARVPRKDVGKRVKGASKAEVDKAVARLVDAGQARVVVRTAVEVVVGPGERVLAGPELTRLDRMVKQLARTLKKVVAKGLPRSLLREDVDALFDAVELSTRQQPGDRARLVDAALRSLEDATLLLVPVPDLVRSLEGRLSLAEIHGALDDAARANLIELRPGTDGDLVRRDDARLCPPGPRETLLTHARRLSS
jgi:hypothetical protein